MDDSKSETAELLSSECKEEMGSPDSEKAYQSFDANSVDSNKTLTANQNPTESNESIDRIKMDIKSKTLDSRDTNRSHIRDPVFRTEPLGRNFFTLPRLLSGRRKRMKRKGIVTNESAVTSIEEHPETDSTGRLSPNATNTFDEYKENHFYVKESFFMRLMRHLASPVHGSAHGHSLHQNNGYSSSRASMRRSRRESFTSSASNGDISKNQLFVDQNNIQSLPRNHTTNSGYEIPAVCGIKNHGNTCYVNSIIQCLCNTDLLAEYFVMNHYRIDLMRHNKLHARKYGTKGELTEQLALLLKSLWSCMYSSEISNKFKTLMAKYNSQYEGSEQQDAQEFLLWLLDKCHEDLNIANKKKYKKIKGLSANRTDEVIAAETLANHMRCNSSFIHDLFQAQLRSTLVCRSCGKHSNTFDPYLCLSLPVPTRLTHTIIVTSVFLSKTPRELKIGVSIESLATIREFRDKISRLLKIPEKQLVLLLIGQDFGLKELVKDTNIVQETLEDMDNVFAVETPKLPQVFSNSNAISADNSGEQLLTLVWTNRVGIGSQGNIFGPLFSILVSREASYKQIQLDILNGMRSILKNNIEFNFSNLKLRLRVIGGIPGKAYLPEDVDHPLYMPTVDRALTSCEDKDYRGPIHLKLVVEWDLDIRNSLIINEEEMEKPITDNSIELAKAHSQRTNRATLRDCFDMYFKEERLAADNAWICPSCRRRQQCTKKLSLWSVPDIFIIHLKRFRQSSNSQRTKVTTHVLFPLNGLEMSAYIAPRYGQTNGNINNANGLPALWSPWKKSRMVSRLLRSDDNTYDLYAVCNHKGNMQSGHYTAYCRNPIDSCWYLFDDTKVVPVSESSIVTSDAYILFYHRSSLSSALSSCASSSTSGYSSSASSYYSDHWAFRMPPFNYWSPKTSKSQDNLSSETINERNSAKNGSTTPPTPTSLSRDARPYASLPSKSTQLRAKYLQTEAKTKVSVNPINADANDRQTPVSNVDNNLDSNDPIKNREHSEDSPEKVVEHFEKNESDRTTGRVNDRTVLSPKANNSKYWAITSV